MVKIYAKSIIDSNGEQYWIGMQEDGRIDTHGMLNGKAWEIRCNYRRNETYVYTFRWVCGVPCDFERTKKYADEVMVENEFSKVLEQCNISYLEVM